MLEQHPAAAPCVAAHIPSEVMKPLAGLVTCYSCCHHTGTPAAWWLRPHKLMQDDAQSCCYTGCAPTDSWEVSELALLGCGCQGRVGPQLTPFPPVFEHGPIPQWECRCVLSPIPACNPPAHRQDPSWRGITQSLKPNYDSPCFWKPFESFLCHGHLVFTSQLLQPISFHKNFK